ncbi:MAG: cation-translocating P-type ATPase, partial [Planctomycetes bacterium]|nr:cation-translocating P-type ATPase [Planctomycetota bacterium]
DVAINSASIALMNNDLNRLSFLMRLSRITRRVVNQNLAFGVVFIILGIIFSGKGWIDNPIIAVMLHLVSSLIIVFNSARLVRFGEELDSVPMAGKQEFAEEDVETMGVAPAPA